MKKKKKLYITAASCAAVLCLVGGIFAYLSDHDDRDNTVKIAENKIEITESFPEPKVQTANKNIYEKQVKITNEGNTPTYVRVYLDFGNSEMAKRSYLSLDGKTYYPVVAGVTPPTVDGVTFGTELYQNKIESLTKVPDSDTDYWVYDSNDGFYYYTGKIAPEAATEALMEKLLIYNEADQATIIREVKLYVYTESVQTVDANGEEYVSDGTSAAYKKAWKAYTEDAAAAGNGGE